ncbi:MAG TPA: DUF3857 domain-containing protein [Smithella sp.]|nr:DUF3857 domain-containing protein [Smithella sp.]HOG90411.1 DUF3857 domain-containing protein [Smithella sp.]
MRFHRNILILLSIFILSCSAGNPNIRSISEGNVYSFLEKAPKAEQHPNAGADLLYSYSYVEFFEDGTSVTRVLERYKIFNERGRNFATKSISYREGYQEVKIIFANTIKPDGKIIALDEKDIQDASQHAGYEFYTDIKVKKFTMPAVENDCVIEIAYELKNLKPILDMDYADTFFCQNLFPIEEDIAEIVLPAGTELKYKKFKTEMIPQIQTDGKKTRYILVNKSQKEIIPESRMPSLLDRETFPQLSYWTLKDWNIISKWYNKLFREQMKSNEDLERFTKELIADKKTEEEKINVIFNFVSQNIRYIAVLLGPHTHKPHEAFEIFRKRYGDCKDKTVLLLTMLKIAGIQGMPALVPATGKYFDESIPSINAFNHVIAAVPFQDKYFWLDATNETASFDSPPFTLPTKVFLIHEDGSYRFITTPSLDNKKDYYQLDIRYNIEGEGNADIDYTYQFFGKAAESIRYSFKYAPPEQRKKFFENSGIEVKSLQLGSFTDTRNPFIIRLSGTMKNLAQVLDEETMVLSNILSFDAYKDITAANDRRYPINLTQSVYAIEKNSYKFPAGFKIKKLPRNYVFDKPFRFRSEKYSFNDSVFDISVESKNEEYILPLDNLHEFKKYAEELQKHESSIKNIIFEKK